MKNYDPGKIVVTFRGIRLVLFAEGTFVSVEREEDAFSKSVGADGNVTRVRNRNRSGSVTCTLQAESPINDILSAIAKEDELFGTGFGSIQVENLLGTTLVNAPTAWIRKLPTVEFSDEASTREWIFDCDTLDMVVGGSLI